MDDMPKNLHDCMKILDESMDILTDLETFLEEEKEDQIIPKMKLHELYDMTEDVFQSSKLKRAETNLVKRQTGDYL